MKFDAKNYIKVLQEGLFPPAHEMFQNNWEFMQDNAPAHRAKMVKEFLTAKVPGRILPHPAKSPDLNPIEHVWAILKHKIEKMMPKDKNQLIEFIKQA